MLGKMIAALSWRLLYMFSFASMLVMIYNKDWTAAILFLLLGYYCEGKALTCEVRIKLAERIANMDKDKP